MMLAHKNTANEYSSTKVQKNAFLKYFIEIDYRRVNLIKAINYKVFFENVYQQILKQLDYFNRTVRLQILKSKKWKNWGIS